MPKVLIRKALEDDIRKCLLASDFEGVRDRARIEKVLRQLVALIDDSKVTKERSTTIPPLTVLQIMKRVMGPSLVIPPAYSRGDFKALTPLFTLIKNRVALLGMDEADIEKAAERALKRMKLPAGVDWVVKSFDRLLADEEEAPQTTGGTVNLGLPDEG